MPQTTTVCHPVRRKARPSPALNFYSFDKATVVVYSVCTTTDTTDTNNKEQTMTNADTDIDISKLEKIRALLDKAESTATEFPAEAESLTAKAIEMMERYRIDEAMIADSAPLQDRGKIIEVRINAGAGPYVNARVSLADQVAQNHSVKLLQSTGYNGKVIYLIGYETDVALTEMLYTSLLVQATRAMGSSEVRATKPGHVHGTAFSRSFLLSFAGVIGKRLRETTSATSTATTSPDSSRCVALVLADRYKDVENDVLRRYGKIGPTPRQQTAASSLEGSTAGSRAANRADINMDRRVSGKYRQELSA